MVDEAQFRGPDDRWPRHAKKEIEAALAEARRRGWWLRLEAHFGTIYCSRSDRREGCCSIVIAGTPENPGRRATQILSKLKQCRHRDTGEE